jgi:internalin A
MQLPIPTYRLALSFVVAMTCLGSQKDSKPNPKSSEPKVSIDANPHPTIPSPVPANLPTEQKSSEPVRSKPIDPKNEDPEVLALVNKKGWKIIYDQPLYGRLTHITIEDSEYKKAVTDDDYKTLAKSKTVQSLVLYNVDDAGLKALAAIPHLEKILVSGKAVTDVGIKALASCKTLKKITLHTDNVTDAGIKELAVLPNLQELNCGFMSINGSAFEAFKQCKTLTSLDIDYVAQFNDDGVRHLSLLPNLNELTIKKGDKDSKFTSAGLKMIVDTRLPDKFNIDKEILDDTLLEALVAKGWLYGPTLPDHYHKPATADKVDTISIERSQVTDKGFAAVLHCSNIHTLLAEQSQITDETLKKLTNFKNLKYLELGRTKITAEGLNALTVLPIKRIDMRKSDLTEEMFKAFSKMPHLEELRLSETKLKAEWLQHLSTSPKLRRLDLMNTSVDDTFANYLIALPSLEEIKLEDTKLGDVGFQKLLALPKLENLNVNGTKVTKQVSEKAKKDYPKRTFRFPSYDP